MGELLNISVPYGATARKQMVLRQQVLAADDHRPGNSTARQTVKMVTGLHPVACLILSIVNV
ncbi:hypothetical protein T265_06705 [Opisthorchis viverrini]|uniref:Uncharacterized protein n=1 Tax=Opisthorchis viverrini TaxID=6198 RepID=A0A075ADB1_OPIVI|nr:hypothetical protein T265_06705 [Opisthorchis viverrini]KER25954.1 hypothetical protein T265_06705 [Opisthorchis viverrini]